ncbi:MAG: hypothetical protein PHF00_09450, partial [Elusimicrobia bacterium]|nr:hypothetical protein [Elusimicrobiota bacterium]
PCQARGTDGPAGAGGRTALPGLSGSSVPLRGPGFGVLRTPKGHACCPQKSTTVHRKKKEAKNKEDRPTMITYPSATFLDDLTRGALCCCGAY